MKKILVLAALTGAGLTGSPGFAQNMPANPQQTPSAVPAPDQAPPQTAAPVQVKVGDTIYDPSGSPVGTIQTVQASTAALSTGTVTVTIPLSTITQGSKGPMIAQTRAEVEARAKPGAPPRQ